MTEAARPSPYSPRELTRRELQRKDVYSFTSPRLNRLVRVVGPINLGAGLLHEFTPDCKAYVERPRVLTCGNTTYEIDFWHVDANGRERLTMVVPAQLSVAAEGGRRRHRQAIQLLEAAEQARLPLEFLQENDVIAKADDIRNAFRLLPSVQLARRLPNRVILREHILQLLTDFESPRIEFIESTLDRLPPADVRCVVADLLHEGLIHLVDRGPIRVSSRVKKGAP